MKPHGNLRNNRDFSNLRGNGHHGKMSTLESEQCLPNVVTSNVLG